MRFGSGVALASTAAMMLAGCGPKTLVLPDDPIERAATCSVVAATAERVAAGVKGVLPAEAQGRIFQYALLAASEGGTYDAEKASAVFKRSPALSEAVAKTKWQEAQPACDAAYPATKITTPKLPDSPLDSMLQCFMTVDFMRKALGDAGASYADAAREYGLFATQLDGRLGPALTRAGIKGAAVQERRKKAQAEAAQLGQPGAVIEACRKKYPA